MDVLNVISYGRIENKLMYPHRNPGMELVLVEEGHLEWAVEGIPEMLNPGTVFFTLPWQAHGSLNVREPRNRICYTLFELPGNYEQPSEQIQMPEALGFHEDELHLVSSVLVSAQHHAWPASDLLKVLFPELIKRLDGGTPTDRSAARTLLRMIVVELVDIIQRNLACHELETVTQGRVRRFLNKLRFALDEPWTLEGMAEACGVKRTQFAKVIKQLTGYPPLQYLNRIRIEHARSLLRNTELPVTEIAFECGFSTSQYFAAAFRKAVRMTPSEYRRHLPELEAIMAANWNHPEERTVSDERERSRRLGR